MRLAIPVWQRVRGAVAGMRDVRYYGYCQPAAKAKREHVAFRLRARFLLSSF
ncbi:MAG: hypothetical protein H8M99_04135 [Gloeobacteraceae cyanobacterium ES-bin-144]|nr:hypothetical protein [Verrucomicrobiales bacterium]